MKKEIEFLKNKLHRYVEAHHALELLIRDKVIDKKHLPSVRVMVKKFNSMCEKIGNQITTIQKNCNHNFEYKGHGHVYDFYDCTECDKSEER
jgi:hypothetical protein